MGMRHWSPRHSHAHVSSTCLLRTLSAPHRIAHPLPFQKGRMRTWERLDQGQTKPTRASTKSYSLHVHIIGFEGLCSSSSLGAGSILSMRFPRQCLMSGISRTCRSLDYNPGFTFIASQCLLTAWKGFLCHVLPAFSGCLKSWRRNTQPLHSCILHALQPVTTWSTVLS